MTGEAELDEAEATDGETGVEGSDLVGRSDDVLAGGEGEAVGSALSVELAIDRVTGRLRSIGESVKLREFGRPGRGETREEE